jgi:hypothetical protein
MHWYVAWTFLTKLLSFACLPAWLLAQVAKLAQQHAPASKRYKAQARRRTGTKADAAEPAEPVQPQPLTADELLDLVTSHAKKQLHLAKVRTAFSFERMRSSSQCMQSGPQYTQSYMQPGPQYTQSYMQPGPQYTQSYMQPGPQYTQSYMQSGPQYTQSYMQSGPQYTQSYMQPGPQYTQSYMQPGPQYTQSYMQSGPQYTQSYMQSGPLVSPEPSSPPTCLVSSASSASRAG